MKAESANCFMFFILQLFFFHLSSFLLMWTLYSTFTAIVINIILLVFLALFIYNGFEIYSQLHVSDQEAVQGRFSNFGQEQSAISEQSDQPQQLRPHQQPKIQNNKQAVQPQPDSGESVFQAGN